MRLNGLIPSSLEAVADLTIKRESSNMAKFTFQKMCAMLAAKRCYESGQSVEAIAVSAKKSPAVIYGWLKEAGVVIRQTRT